MLEVKTSRPIIEKGSDYVYSNARGDSKDGFVKKEDRLFSESNKGARQMARLKAQEEKKLLKSEFKKGSMSRKEFRQAKRSNRKAKRNATKLQVLKRLSKDGKPLFTYRLKKLVRLPNGTARKTMPDGSTVDVKAENQIETKQGVYDITEIAKAMGIQADQVTFQNNEIISRLIALEKGSQNQQQVAETTKNSPDVDLAVLVKEGDVEESDDGDFYVTDETQEVSDTDQKDVKDEDKEKQGMSTTTKVIIAVSSVVVVGLLVYIIIKSTKPKV